MNAPAKCEGCGKERQDVTWSAIQERALCGACYFPSNGGDVTPSLPATDMPDMPERSSWEPVDLGEALKGVTEPAPTILKRSDGAALLYDGRLHQLSAEPESGKGWFACSAAAELIAAGCVVAYFDFEANAPELVGRLQALGLSDDAILERFIYVHPHEPIETAPDALGRVLARQPALVIFDGITEALSLHGLDLGDNGDVAKWLELAPRPAVRSGAAVLLIDHEVKAKDNRARFAIGAQHKLAGVDVAFKLEVVEPFGVGREGTVKVRVAKDRPGRLTSCSIGTSREIALMQVRPSDDELCISFDPPKEAGEFKPTEAMAKVSTAIEANPGMTKRDLRDYPFGFGKGTIDKALTCLIADGYVRRSEEGQAHCHYSVRSFIAEEDG